MGQFRRHAGDAANRDAKLAIVDGADPGRRARHVKKGLFGVERDDDGVMR